MTLDYELQQGSFYDIWADIFDADNEEGEPVVRAEVDLYVGPFERSFYRSAGREINVNKLIVWEFGRKYEFTLDEVFGSQSDEVEGQIVEFYEGMEEDY